MLGPLGRAHKPLCSQGWQRLPLQLPSTPECANACTPAFTLSPCAACSLLQPPFPPLHTLVGSSAVQPTCLCGKQAQEALCTMHSCTVEEAE